MDNVQEEIPELFAQARVTGNSEVPREAMFYLPLWLENVPNDHAAIIVSGRVSTYIVSSRYKHVRDRRASAPLDPYRARYQDKHVGYGYALVWSGPYWARYQNKHVRSILEPDGQAIPSFDCPIFNGSNQITRSSAFLCGSPCL
jgi:hypothetical protein